MSDKGNELDMLTAQQVHDLTGVPISTLHDWASKRAALRRQDRTTYASAIVTAGGRDAMLLHGSTRRGSNPMTTHEVACRIDDNEVDTGTMRFMR
jgi:hypothetical protein